MVTTGDLDRRTKQLGNDVVSLHERIDAFRSETRERLDGVESAVRENTVQIGRLTQQVAGHDRRFEEINVRFEKIDDRFEKIDDRFEKIDGRLERIDGRLERIDGTLGTHTGQLGQLDDHVVVVRQQMGRLLVHFGLEDSSAEG